MSAPGKEATARFFDEMAPRYDSDLVDLGWDPVALVQGWPIRVPAHAHLVDAGCGTGALLETFRGAGRSLTGFDLSPQMVNRARRRTALKAARMEVCSADERWPVDDGDADVVFAIAMLEFVEHLERPLDEMHRVLRPGGRGFFTVEERHDWAGIERESHEVRYGEFSLWRRDRDDVDMALPPGLTIVRDERVRAYTVLERGFTAAYRAFEVERTPD